MNEVLLEMPEEHRKKLDALFEAFDIIAGGSNVYLCDMRYDISRWSQNAVDYFGLPGMYMKGAGDIWAQHVHPDDRESYAHSIAQLFQGDAAEHDMQYRARAKDGSYTVCTCRGVIVCNPDGQPEYFAGSIQNHGQLSYVDTTTGLRSLYGFFDDLRSMFFRKDPGAIIQIGLSSFSNVNDIYGYTFGNSVLHEIANRLRIHFANKGDVYRMDGTKFAVITHVLSPDELSSLYKEFKRRMAHDFVIEGKRISLPLNAGIVMVDNFDISTETVYSCLKYAYYDSKSRKLGDAVIFADALTDDNRHYVEKLNVIRNSVTQNCKGFFLCYQPIMDAKTEQLKGMEALLRWKSEDYGTVPPIQFVPILEQDTLFPELGRWILRTAMEDGKLLLGKYPKFLMNVNLSYAQLETSSFVNDVIQLLDDTGFPPENLCLEITERCRMLDMSLLKNMFKIFREKGIKVALDDFGTGFSSLGLLREVPVDTVKIDREYVKNVENSSADQSTIRSISGLAESFRTEICVEGVETAEMRDFLRQYQNVSSLQGYYYSKPIPMDEFIQKYLTGSAPAA
ncbi:MAG: EAL domain-containing protein [Oscillospiraceae bacterium]|nr:EAL domain-containing protein [Oscillospiraceae bacterium]